MKITRSTFNILTENLMIKIFGKLEVRTQIAVWQYDRINHALGSRPKLKTAAQINQ